MNVSRIITYRVIPPGGGDPRQEVVHDLPTRPKDLSIFEHAELLKSEGFEVVEVVNCEIAKHE